MVMDLSLVVGLVAWCGAGTAKDARGSVRTDLGTHGMSPVGGRGRGRAVTGKYHLDTCCT